MVKPVHPRRVLMIGCGLIGTSMALAITDHYPDTVVDGVDTSRRHRDLAVETKTFHQVFAELPNEQYDLAVLAIPVQAACALLVPASEHAALVMDVCSVKVPICDEALQAGLADTFVPTHPMAGTAGQGPMAGIRSLFEQQPWILLRDWDTSGLLTEWLAGLGAKIEWADSAAEHDAAMAAVSHGNHLMSVTAMLAADGGLRETGGQTWPGFTGPGFRDVTRLSASGHGFWVPTLMGNRESVLSYLERAQETLEALQRVLRQRDEQGLASILKQAKQAKDRWTERQV